MPNLYPLAEELNRIINAANPAVFDLLSDRGRAIYFPKAGILGQTAEAKGKKINATIGIGLDDDGLPIRLESIASRVDLPLNEVFPYAPGYGKPELRKKWQDLIREKNPSLASPVSLPIATNALTNALSLAGYLFVNSGDKIILADRFWGTYRLIFEHAYGGELATFNTFKAGGFDLERFTAALETEEKKKIVLLNFPNNPSGYSPTEAEARAIAEIVRERAESGDKILVLIDDAYFGLVYEDGIYRESLFSLLAGVHENVLAIKIDGPTKEDYVWGLRVGFITYGIKGGTPELYSAFEDKTAGAVRGNVSNISNLSQSLVLHGLTSPNYAAEKQQKFELLKSRYQTIKQAVSKPECADYFSPLPCNSGYFICLKLAQGLDAEQVRKLLLAKYDTGVIALKDSIRLAFSAVPTDKIPELVENVYRACLEILNKSEARSTKSETNSNDRNSKFKTALNL